VSTTDGPKEGRQMSTATTSKRRDFEGRDIKGRNLAWIRRLLLVGIGAVVALTAYLFARYPAALSDGLTLIYTITGAVALAIYAFFALRDTRQVDAESATITRYGVGCALFVFFAVIAQTFGGELSDWGALPPYLFENMSTLLATAGLISVVGGILVSWQVNKVAAGAFMGAWAALVAGIGSAVVLLGAAALLAPNTIMFFTSPILPSATQSAPVAGAVVRVVGLLVLLPLYTIIGGTLGDLIGIVLARIGTFIRNGSRRTRASTRLVIARSQLRRGRLSAAATELGIILED